MEWVAFSSSDSVGLEGVPLLPLPSFPCWGEWGDPTVILFTYKPVGPGATPSGSKVVTYVQCSIRPPGSGSWPLPPHPPHLHPEPRVGAQLDREARSAHLRDVNLTLQPSQA